MTTSDRGNEVSAGGQAALEQDEEIQRADPKTRRRVLIYLTVTAVVSLVLIGVLEEWLHRLGENAAGDPHAASDEAARLLSILGAVISASLFGMALVVARLSWRIIRADRFPPPDAILTVDVRVLHGASARRRAYVGLFAATLLAALAVLFPYFLWRALHTLAPTYS